MARKVLVIEPIDDAGMALFEARADVEVAVTRETDEASLIAALGDVHGITVRTAPITRAVIDAAPLLEVVSRHGVGYDAVDVAALTERGIPLTIAIHGNAVSVAEHAMYLLLALAKKGLAYDRATRAGDWGFRKGFHGTDLSGKRLLVIGFGRTGTRTAARALAFEMEVHAYDPYVDPAVIRAAGCVPVADYRAVLGQVDAVSVHCPRTGETDRMLGAGEFAAMKGSALLVNCARGGIVDEDALLGALGAGEIAGAGLDVFAVEPAGADHPLFALDNVLVSPHVAGVTREAGMRMAQGAAGNVLAAFDGALDPAVVVNDEVLGARSGQESTTGGGACAPAPQRESIE